LTGLAVLSRGSPEKREPARPSVPVLKANAVFSSAIEQVTTASPKRGFEVPSSVCSLQEGLLHLQKTSERPILAMAESEGWFFYATSVVRSSETGDPEHFISGYAIKRGSRRVVGWSVW